MEKDYKVLAEDINQNLSIFRVLDYYGIWYRSQAFPSNISCPVMGPGHSGTEDSRPSCRVFPDSNKIHCFTCGEHGGPLLIVMKRENLRFREAVDFLVRTFGSSIQDVSDWRTKVSAKLSQQKAADHDYLGMAAMSVEKLREWAKILLPQRTSLFFHIQPIFFAFEYNMDYYTSMKRFVSNLPDPVVEYTQMLDRCKEIVRSWKDQSTDEDVAPLEILRKLSPKFSYTEIL